VIKDIRFDWIGLHQSDFIMFKPTMQELLNIDQFFHWMFNKIKTFKIRRLECFYILLESAQWVRFYGGDFVVFRPLVHEIF